MKKENIVIKHHGLVILRENQVKLVSDTPYLSVADGSLEGIIDNKHITNTYNENIKTLSKNDTEKKQKWDSIEESFAAIGMNYERIIRLIKLLRQAKEKKDLEKIYQEVLQGMDIRTRKEIEEAYQEYPELILSIMSKAIATGYVKSQLKRTNPSKIIVLQTRKAKGDSLQELMEDTFELDFSEESTNGVDKLLAKSYCDNLDKEYRKISSECFDCANGYVNCCEKIADYPRKKDISEYPFITDGFQLSVNDELEKFIVTRCRNFKKAPKTPALTEKQKMQVRDALKLIHLLYRDVDTEAEAIEIDERNKTLGYK